MRRVSHARYPLDRLFSNSSHIAILHALRDGRQGMSGRAIARHAGINHQSCAVALRTLESLGVLERHGNGRTQLLHLNFDSHLVKDLIVPLLHKETDLFKDALKDMTSHFQREAATITLFGSVARGQDVLGSDMDVLLTALDGGKHKLLEKAADYSVSFTKKFGIRLSPMVLTLAEVRMKARQKDRLLQNILSDGLDLLPKKLQEVLE
jgi:predicted nucleotidyltransferase